MKVCVISHSAVVDVYRQKFHRLAELGVEVHLLMPARWPEGNRWVEAPKPGYEKGIYMSIFPVRWAGKVGGFYLPGLTAWLRRLQPDILHLEEEPYALIGWQAVRALHAQKRRVVFFTWENILRPYKFPLSWIDRWMLKQARWAIAGNHEAAQVLRQRGYAGNVAVIPQYGVDPKLFAPQAASPAHPVWTIGFLGRLLEEKGLHTLLNAVATLNFNYELVLTGQGPMAEALKTQVARLGLEARVRFVSSVPNAEVPQALRALDVLVLPSETRKDWKEQFGRVLVEAMACGVPVVGSDSGEIPHVIGEAGLVFPEGQAARLAECLTRLHTDTALHARCVEQGRTRALAEFTNEGIARKTFAFYQSILGGRR